MCALVGVYSHCDQNNVKMSSSKTAVGTGDASFSDAPSASDTNPNGPWKRMPHSARACVPEGAHLRGKIAGSALFVRRGQPIVHLRVLTKYRIIIESLCYKTQFVKN